MVKRILIVSDPPAAPGYLPRLRYLCDYLVQKGYEVTLLTEQYQNLAFAHSYPIQTIPMYSGGTLDWTLKTVWTLLTDWHNRAFARKYLTAKRSNSEVVYDVVLCTAFSDFPLGAAQRIAQVLHVPFICDIRDLDEQVDDSRYQYHHQTWWTMPFRRIYRAIHIRRRNRVLRQADTITTVSPWHADFIRRFNPNVHVVYNGYDARQFYPENVAAEQFTVSYIGSLFDWQQPALEKVQKAIDELNSSQLSTLHTELADRKNSQLSIHTPQNNPIAHTELGDAIRRSSVMLVLTSPHTHGMMTTKFFEALGCEKPILCVPSDKGCLEETIRSTNAGMATDDVEQIKAFLLDKYREWKQNGFTRQQTQHREQFSREYQCARLEEILTTNDQLLTTNY